jgi:hemolysin activation/secretion protein
MVSAQPVPLEDDNQSNFPNPIEEIQPTPPPELPSTPPPPPAPNLGVPAPPAIPQPNAPGNLQFNVNRIEIVGSPLVHPVFRGGVAANAQPTLEALIQQSGACDLIRPVLARLSELRQESPTIALDFQDCRVSFEDLVRLRSAITLLYTSNGFISSGAFLPNNQDLASGTIQIQVVEGELERIDISGLNRLRESYVRSRLNLAVETPLNQSDLERALQLLQVDPLIEQIDAELTAGSSPGRNILQVRLQEAPPFQASVSVDNYQSDSIGSVQGTAFASYDNLLGLGDRISAQYSLTEGLDLYSLGYSIPVNPREGTLSFRYSRDDSQIITREFEEFGITSAAETFSVGFRQPLYRTAADEFAVGVAVDLRRSQTYILEDEPFSFSEGAEDGASKATVLRFYQEWVDRDRTRVVAARSQFSFGLDVLDATVNDSGTDGRFISWLGQFQWVEQVRPSRVLAIGRINAQLTPDSLLSFERVGLGGVDTVRGYAQNQIVTDNAVWGSLEARIPLLASDRLQLVPFLDAGYAWNNRTPDPVDDFLASVGVGVRWLITPELDLRLDYGIPLVEVDDQGDSLQDNGFYFLLRYQPF